MPRWVRRSGTLPEHPGGCVRRPNHVPVKVGVGSVSGAVGEVKRAWGATPGGNSSRGNSLSRSFGDRDALSGPWATRRFFLSLPPRVPRSFPLEPRDHVFPLVSFAFPRCGRAAASPCGRPLYRTGGPIFLCCGWMAFVPPFGRAGLTSPVLFNSWPSRDANLLVWTATQPEGLAR